MMNDPPSYSGSAASNQNGASANAQYQSTDEKVAPVNSAAPSPVQSQSQYQQQSFGTSAGPPQSPPQQQQQWNPYAQASQGATGFTFNQQHTPNASIGMQSSPGTPGYSQSQMASLNQRQQSYHVDEKDTQSGSPPPQGFVPPAAPPAAAPPHMQQPWGANPQNPYPNPQMPAQTGSFNGPGTYNPAMQQQQPGWNPGMQAGSMGQQGMPMGHMPVQMGSINQMGQMQPAMAPGNYVTPELQCQQQGHIITTTYGVVGLLTAILFFPCGVIVCMMDKTERCARCHQVFRRGLLD